MKIKKLSLLAAGAVLVAAMATACGSTESQTGAGANADTQSTANSTTETTSSEVIQPVNALTSAEEALADGGYSVSFSAENLVQNGDGYELTAEVFEYDRYEKDAIKGITVGSQIQVCNKTVTVESIDGNFETGLIAINGGMENDGYDLREEDGFYRTSIANDYPLYYSVGTITIPLSTDATFEDHSDSEKEPDGILYEYADIPDAIQNSSMFFGPENTILTVRGEEIVQIIRYWIP